MQKFKMEWSKKNFAFFLISFDLNMWAIRLILFIIQKINLFFVLKKFLYITDDEK